MLIARVVGTAVSTIKDEKVKGRKLLILKQTDPAGKLIGKPFVAVDLVDAGEGELVLTGHGSSARQTHLTKDCPVDAVVVAVVDTLDVDGENVFRKE
jgi:microcompartment protein CcmK/EutM